MRVYIATKFENRQAAAALALVLENAGHTITYKWWEHEAWDWSNREEVERRAPEIAENDLEGVLEADVFICLTFEDGRAMVGSLVEMGAAMANGAVVYVVGEQYYNVFSYHPSVHRLDSLEQLEEELLLARLRRGI